MYTHNIAPAPNVVPWGYEFAGNVALWQGWLSYTWSLNLPYDWAVLLFPRGPYAQTNFAQGHMFSIPVNAANPDDAWIFLEWMASFEGQKAIVAAGRRQPIGPWGELWELFFDRLPAEKRAHVQQWLLGTLYGPNLVRNASYWRSYPEMNQIMREHLTNIFQLNQPIRNELENAARRMQALLDSE